MTSGHHRRPRNFTTPHALNAHPIPTTDPDIVVLRGMLFHAKFTEPRWAPILLSSDGIAFHFDLSLLAEVSSFFHRLQHLPSRGTDFAREPESLALHVAKSNALALVLQLVKDDHLYHAGLGVPPIPLVHDSPEVRINLYDIFYAYEFSERMQWYLPHPAWAGSIAEPSRAEREHEAIVERQTQAAVRGESVFWDT
ncbi:hypothetical protein Q8F55_006077 [Vanrija albida]|uniref:BTB domain-containing protein n=1 Tax=Vanrija albida TaxID=181172 RepID=A0ABR3Q3C5_9TREE